MKRKILIVFALLATGFGACKKIDCGGNNPSNNCSGVFCTAVFDEEHMEVRYSNGTPVNLDAFVVTDAAGTPLPKANGQDVYGYPHNGNGKYTIINDAWVQGHQNTTKTVRAKGYINGTEVFNEPFTIGADCCHVNMTTGNSTVTINQQ
jgi:hypothetical protein